MSKTIMSKKSKLEKILDKEYKKQLTDGCHFGIGYMIFDDGLTDSIKVRLYIGQDGCVKKCAYDFCYDKNIKSNICSAYDYKLLLKQTVSSHIKAFNSWLKEHATELWRR